MKEMKEGRKEGKAGSEGKGRKDLSDKSDGVGEDELGVFQPKARKVESRPVRHVIP